MSLNEALTRIRLIDPQLRQAGWHLDDKTQVRREIPVDGYDAEPWNGVTDYCLYQPDGQVLAVVEAKRCSRNPREADEQLRHYVTEITKRQSFAPFGFMTNGHATHFWELGLANPRLYLDHKRFESPGPSTEVIHYSGQNARARKQWIDAQEDRRTAFEKFKGLSGSDEPAEVSRDDLIRTAENVFNASPEAEKFREETLSQLKRTQLTESRQKLIFHYKLQFDELKKKRARV
jgi:hypothetical protein